METEPYLIIIGTVNLYIQGTHIGRNPYLYIFC